MKTPLLLLGLLALTIFLSGCIQPPAQCPNGVCETNENCENCALDCGPCAAECGNGKCETGETVENCPQDCEGKTNCCIPYCNEWVGEEPDCKQQNCDTSCEYNTKQCPCPPFCSNDPDCTQEKIE